MTKNDYKKLQELKKKDYHEYMMTKYPELKEVENNYNFTMFVLNFLIVLPFVAIGVYLLMDKLNLI